MRSKWGIIGVLGLFALVAIGCSSDDDDTTNPTGPTSDSPVGNYVGVVQSTGYTTMANVSPTAVGLVGESFPVTISGSLVLTMFDDYPFRTTQTTQLTEESDGVYVGSYQVGDPSGWVQFSFSISWDSTAGEWQAVVTTGYDTNNDGAPEQSGSMVVALKPRLNWSAYAGNWRAAVIYIDGETAFPSLEIQDAVLSAGGTVQGAWFYNDGGTVRALAYSNADEEAISFRMVSLGSTYLHLTARGLMLPTIGTIGPNPENWNAGSDSSDVHAVPMARLAAFADDDVLLSITGQVEEDTDGLDVEDEYPYFSADLVGQDVIADIASDGTMEITMGATPLTTYYGYMEMAGSGYLAGMRADTGDTWFNTNFFVLELDASNQTTGNGFMQGYDIPDLDDDSEIDDAEILVIDNEGVLTFGSGFNPDLFEFIQTL
ncbi:hypothetical protein GF356_03790 [candidate division GN15 bacterium]|nr:hypothetical protein [candidate division GN15 bacterium]